MPFTVSTAFAAGVLLSALASASPVGATSSPSRVVRAAVDPPAYVFTDNYAGAVQVAPPAPGQSYTAVSMQIVVSTPVIPKGGNKSWYIGGARVAIDGYPGVSAAVLTTGVNWNVNTDGFLAAYPFTAWEPQKAKDYTHNISVKPGDLVEISVEATNATAGVTTIKNLSNGQTTSENLAAASGAPGLVGQNALWAVDAFHYNGSALPVADFGTVKLTAAAWKASGGATGGTQGATVLGVQQGEKVYTKTNVVSDSEIDIVFMG